MGGTYKHLKPKTRPGTHRNGLRIAGISSEIRHSPHPMKGEREDEWFSCNLAGSRDKIKYNQFFNSRLDNNGESG